MTGLRIGNAIWQLVYGTPLPGQVTPIPSQHPFRSLTLVPKEPK